MSSSKLFEMSLIYLLFVLVDISYANGHKKYVFWDLYQVDKNDQNPKIIFKVEDKFQEYLKIFEEANNGKYQELYQITPSK